MEIHNKFIIALFGHDFITSIFCNEKLDIYDINMLWTIFMKT